MAINGDLRTMTLVELLQWASGNRKTGLLELERNKVCRRLTFREGHISACSSDDPSHLLGQFLLSQSKITPQTLRFALRQQQGCSRPLGEILIDMGLLTADDVAQEIDAKTEEMIYGMFAWEDAIFRFRRDTPAIRYEIKVELTTEEIIGKGAERFDELALIRAAFNSSGVVLRRTANPLPHDLPRPRMAAKVLAAIDGRRTLGEILLHAHGSEFVVLEVLHMLYSKGLIEVVDERPVDATAPTLIDAGRTGVSVGFGPGVDLSELVPEDMRAHIGDLAPSERDAAHEAAGSAEFGRLVESALGLINDGDLEEALKLLDVCYCRRPADKQVRDLIAAAEAAYVNRLRVEQLSLEAVPVRLSDATTLPAGLQPAELFLYSQIDGKLDVQGFLWTAPLRELVVMRGLKRLCDRGLIRMVGATAGAGTRQTVSAISFADLREEVMVEERGDGSDPSDALFGVPDEFISATMDGSESRE